MKQFKYSIYIPDQAGGILSSLKAICGAAEKSHTQGIPAFVSVGEQT